MVSIEEAEKLVYDIILDGDSKEHFTPEFQDKVIEVIKKIRGDD